MHLILYSAKDETEAQQVTELLESIANGELNMDMLEILIAKTRVVVPDKQPSDWTQTEWDAYYASLPVNAHIMTDEEVHEDMEREAKGEYLDIEAFLLMKPEDHNASG